MRLSSLFALINFHCLCLVVWCGVYNRGTREVSEKLEPESGKHVVSFGLYFLLQFEDVHGLKTKLKLSPKQALTGRLFISHHNECLNYIFHTTRPGDERARGRVEQIFIPGQTWNKLEILS